MMSGEGEARERVWCGNCATTLGVQGEVRERRRGGFVPGMGRSRLVLRPV